jgi:large subunit ribosomal protein L23
MGIFDKLKSKKDSDQVKPEAVKADKPKVEKPETEKVKKSEEKAEPKIEKTDKTKIKGLTNQAYRVLLKPLVTEKASSLGILNQYVFAVDPRMNKVEVKKAIRVIYKVDPVSVNIANFSGKKVRYGRRSGKTKDWKKAIVTLKSGDKIQVYEGV